MAAPDRPGLDPTAFPTIPQASRRSGIPEKRIRRAVRKRELRRYWVGAWPRLSWDELCEWVKSHEDPPGRPRG